MIGYCANPVAILMRYYPLGSLHALIHEQGERPDLQHITYDEKLVFAMATGIASGLGSVHAAGLVHSDMKPANVLLEAKADGSGWIPVITDFGVARFVQHSTSSSNSGDQFLVKGFPISKVLGASVQYAAPELLERLINGESMPASRIHHAQDVYSFGVVLGELMTRIPPWSKEDADPRLIVERMKENANANATNAAILPFPLFSDALAQHPHYADIVPLMVRCLSREPNERPFLADIKTTLDFLHSMLQ